MCWWWWCEMGAALSQPPAHSGGKKKPGGNSSTSLGTLRRRIAAAAKRSHTRTDRNSADAKFFRSVVSGWSRSSLVRLQCVFAAGAELRDLCERADLAREPAHRLSKDLALYTGYLCDVELVCVGGTVGAHRAVLAARSRYFRDLLLDNHGPRIVLPSSMSYRTVVAAINVIYESDGHAGASSEEEGSQNDLDVITTDTLSVEMRAQLGLSPRPLHHDLAYLYHSGELCDVVLQFGPDGDTARVHSAILAARSRLFRNILSGRAGGAVCVDGAVLPGRFAPPLLHAAYTDVIDLSLIKKPPSQGFTSGTSHNTSSWGGLKSNKNQTKVTTAMLEDAFQLYQIARFIEMPIAVQGCEDAIVSWLSPETAPAVLAWAKNAHASQWVYRQCLRYIREELPLVCGGLSLEDLQLVVADPALPHQEVVLLRALVHRAERPEGGSGKSSPSEVREFLSPLLPHLRLHHIPPDNDTLQQALRRGYIPPGAYCADAVYSPPAWIDLARPPRLYQPYIDELKAILDELEIPDIELSHVRHPQISTAPHNIYNVCGGWGRWCAGSWSRVVSLSAGSRHTRARALHPTHYYRQLCLRAVRERSLPDSCADVLLAHIETQPQVDTNGSGARCDSATTNSTRSSITAADVAGGRRRELPAVVSEGQHRGCGGLSLAVPDVAMAPNGNTHLLPHVHYSVYEVPAPAPCLQLDLGDGAPHTPARGSRAARAHRHRDPSQVSQWAPRSSASEERAVYPHSSHTARRCASASSTATRAHTLCRVSSAEAALGPDAARLGTTPTRPHRLDPPLSSSATSSRGPSPNYA